MKAVLTKPKKKLLTLPYTRKLTGEEIEALLDSWDYDPHRFDDDDYDDEIAPLFDEYGNPTVAMMDAFYEDRHDLGETVTLEELFAPYEDD
ncbi:MAG: hypothetical protein IJQ58_03350 [Synergistaceae bacterium]|nr:hypothetical protein [Synergistaceae bacterium]